MAKGLSAGDETAPVVGHEAWGEARNRRPNELFLLFEPEGGIQSASQRQHQRQRFVSNGRRVLDRNDKWMLHWDDVPVTCSSQIEGWHLEALMRRNPDLTMPDIVARMMDNFLCLSRGVVSRRRPFRSSVLTNRTMRFRETSFNVTCKYNGPPQSLCPHLTVVTIT